MYWIGQLAVAVSAAAAVFEAGKKRFDLFGMMVIALAAALGGGSLRDVLLDRPVFWIADQTYLLVALGTALASFIVARWQALPPRFFLLPDAAGLALFTILGTKIAWLLGMPWLVASLMGVITGVVGGILRDILCNEEPLVFQGTLYATAAWLGALSFIVMLEFSVSSDIAALAAGLLILSLRLAAIYWRLELPKYRTR